MIRVVTQRDQIRSVAERWADQYPPAKNRVTASGPANSTHARLRALNPETATPADVERIVGNDSWTDLKCDACETNRLMGVVVVGEEPDYESSTARLCLGCASAAFRSLSDALASGSCR